MKLVIKAVSPTRNRTKDHIKARIKREAGTVASIPKRLRLISSIIDFNESLYEEVIDEDTKPTIVDLYFLRNLYDEQLHEIETIQEHQVMHGKFTLLKKENNVDEDEQKAQIVKLFRIVKSSYEHSSNLRSILEYKLKRLESVVTIDQPSTETAIVYAGMHGSYWYDDALNQYILQNNLFGTDAIKGQINKLVNTDVENLSVISVDDDGNKTGLVFGVIPKNSLIGLLQQILVISNSNDIIDMTDKNKKTWESRKKTINRAVYKIHHDYQISPVRLSQIMQYLKLLDCVETCIMTKSSDWMVRHEDIPIWLQNFYNNPEKCKVETW